MSFLKKAFWGNRDGHKDEDLEAQTATTAVGNEDPLGKPVPSRFGVEKIVTIRDESRLTDKTHSSASSAFPIPPKYNRKKTRDPSPRGHITEQSTHKRFFRRSLRVIFIQLFLDPQTENAEPQLLEHMQQLQFLHSIRFNPFHLFEFVDEATERAYRASRTVLNTHRRIVYVICLAVVFVVLWVFMWLCLDDFNEVDPHISELKIIHIWLSLIANMAVTAGILYVCFVRKYTAIREPLVRSCSEVSSEQRNEPVTNDEDGRRSSAGAAVSSNSSPLMEVDLAMRENTLNRGLTLAIETKRERRQDSTKKDLQERLKLGGITAHPCFAPPVSIAVTALPPASPPWWMPPRPIVNFCCSQIPLLIFFSILSVCACIAHVLSLWIVSESLPATDNRLLMIVLSVYSLASYWFILLVFLTSQSLAISPRNCVFLWLLQLFLLILPPIATAILYGNPYTGELLCFLLAVVSTSWGFIAKAKGDISSRMFFFVVWKQANKGEPQGVTDGGTRTGMEDALHILSQIGRLVSLLATTSPGSLRHTSLTMKVMVKVSECQMLLTRYQDLFKVRVTGNTASVPLQYATMYGIELGVPRPANDVHDLDTAPSIPGHSRRSLLHQPTEMFSSLGTYTPNYDAVSTRIKDVSGIRDHLLERSYRRRSVNDAIAAGEAAFPSTPTPGPLRLNAHDVVEGRRKKPTDVGTLPPRNPTPPSARRITWGFPHEGPESVNDLSPIHSTEQTTLTFKDLPRASNSGASRSSVLNLTFGKGKKTEIDSSATTIKSRRRRRRNPTLGKKRSTGSEARGLLPEDIPQRKLTESLAGVLGKVWTIDLFDLDAKCGGNILVEVGYNLLGEKLTQMIRKHPSTVDATIFDYFSGERKTSQMFRKRSSLIMFGKQNTNVSKHTDEKIHRSTEEQDFHLSVLHLYVLMSFLYCLQEQYRPLPYHNSVHGAHVAHSTACIVNYLHLPGSSAFSPAVEVAYILAALGHDVGHPGRNNQFFINSYDPLSVIYNDMAVLENFHCCLLFMTLELENCNVLFPFTTEVFREIRELIIKLILATDMKAHFQQLSRFKVRRSDPSFSPYNNKEDLKILLEMCIKVGDLASSACTWIVHRDWCFRVVEEFYRQGGEEKELGLPISPLCDRLKHATEFAKSQVGFIEFVTLPLFAELRAFDQEEEKIHQLTVTMTSNKAHWEALSNDSSPEGIAVPLHILDYGKEQRAFEPTSGAGRTDVSKKQRENYKRRRWKSIVGPLSAQPPMPVVESKARRSRSSKRISVEEVSLGDLMTSSSWGEDGDMESIIWPSPDSDNDTSYNGRTETSDEIYGDELRHRWTVSLDSSGEEWLNNPPTSDSDAASSLSRYNTKMKMKRDVALSPSARVAPVEGAKNVKMLDIIKRRASVLTPLEQDRRRSPWGTP